MHLKAWSRTSFSRSTIMQRRNLSLKAKVKSGSSHFAFNRLVRGSFNLGLIGSICTALP